MDRSVKKQLIFWLGRTKDEEALWQEKEPIGRLAATLERLNLATAEALDHIEKEVVAVVDEAVAYAESSPDPEPTDTLQHVFWGED